MENPSALMFSAEYLHSIADLEHAWEVVEHVADAEMSVRIKITIVARESELGGAESALRRLRQLEQTLPEHGVVLKERMEVRLSVAESSFAEEPERTKDLLAEALALHRDWTRQAQTERELPLSLEQTEETLLRLASDLAAVGDRRWSEPALEETLAIMLGHSTHAAFSPRTDVWQIQARAAVAGGMVRIGALDRADALVAEALEAITRIWPPRLRQVAVAAIAKSAAEAPNPSWTAEVAQKLLAVQVVRAGTADVETWTALAHQAIELPAAGQVARAVLPELATIAQDLLSTGDLREYRLDPELKRELGEEVEVVLDGFAAFAANVTDAHEANGIADLAWQLARHIAADISDKRAWLESAIRTVDALTADRIDSMINELEVPKYRAIARALLGALRAEQGTADQADRMIELGLDEAARMASTGETIAVLDEIVNVLPLEAETAGGWLAKILLRVRDEDWHLWLAELLVTSAQEGLRRGDADAPDLIEFASSTAGTAWDPMHAARGWGKIAGAFTLAGNAQSAENAYRRALSSAASAVGSVLESLTGFAQTLDNVQSVSSVISFAALPEYTEIRDEAIVALSRRYAALGAIESAQALVARLATDKQIDAGVQIAVGLAEAGRLKDADAATRRLHSAADRGRAIRGIAAACAASGKFPDAFSFAERLSDTASWIDALTEVTASWLETAAIDDRHEVLPAVRAQLTRRLYGGDSAAALAHIAGALARPGRLSTSSRKVDSGGALAAAALFLGAATSEVTKLDDEQAVAASRRCIVAVTLAGTVDEPDPAMRILWDWIDQASGRTALLASVAEKALDGEHFEIANGACRQILAEADWLWYVTELVVTAGLSEWFDDFGSELFAHSIALARIMPKLVEINESELARSWASELMFGRAYVQATLSIALRSSGDPTGADEVLAEVLDAAQGNGSMEPVISSIALGRALAGAGRMTEALNQAENTPDPSDRNDVIDEIAGTAIDSGALEEGLGILSEMSESDDPFAAYRGEPRVHRAGAAIVEAYAEQAAFEQAVAVFERLDDPWAILPRRAALQTLGKQAADHIANDPTRMANVVFAVAKEARRRGRDDALDCIASFAPVVERVGAAAVVATWTHLQDIHTWSSTRPLGRRRHSDQGRPSSRCLGLVSIAGGQPTSRTPSDDLLLIRKSAG
jgi:hypothetical protein